MASDHSQTIEAAASVASGALKAAVAGTGVAGAGVAIDSTTIALVGLGVTAASFVVNWYYRHREYQLKVREHRRGEPE